MSALPRLKLPKAAESEPALPRAKRLIGGGGGRGFCPKTCFAAEDGGHAGEVFVIPTTGSDQPAPGRRDAIKILRGLNGRDA